MVENVGDFLLLAMLCYVFFTCIIITLLSASCHHRARNVIPIIIK